jgi:hypothetical protein
LAIYAQATIEGDRSAANKLGALLMGAPSTEHNAPDEMGNS